MNIVLFDGDCMLCNSFINFLLKQECETLYFCDLHSQNGRELLSQYQLPTSQFTTLYFLKEGLIYSKSTAVIHILKNLRFRYQLLSKIMLFFPKSLRDWGYNLVAKNRYRLFKKAVCLLPNSFQKAHILT